MSLGNQQNIRATDRRKISIVIVTYKSCNLIDRCLAPLLQRNDYEIVIWENASGDGIGAHITEKYAGYSQIKFIESGQNLGFAKGNNRAFEHCSGRYYLLLNPDAFLDDAATVDALSDFLDREPGVGMAGPRLVNSDGSHQTGDAGWRVGLSTLTAHAFMVQRFVSFMPSLYISNPGLLRRDVVELDWVCGACAMVRREVVDQVGGLDEEIFMYGEDLEWGTRVRDAGWRVCYLPRLSVLHLQGASQKGAGELFYSTKWLDDIGRRYALSSTAAGYAVVRTALTAGFFVRALIWSFVDLVKRDSKAGEKSRIMRRYAAHVWAWPSYRAVVAGR